MPKRYFEPEALFVVDGVECWLTYKTGCAGQSDSAYAYHYTFDAEQVEPECGTSNHFDVRELTLFKELTPQVTAVSDGPYRFEAWERGHHARVILAQLFANPSAIPLGEDIFLA